MTNLYLMKKYSKNISCYQSYIYYVYMSADSDDGSGENARKKEYIKKSERGRHEFLK